MDPTIDEAYRMAQGEEPPDPIETAHSKLFEHANETEAVNQALGVRIRQLNEQNAILAARLTEHEQGRTEEMHLRWVYQFGFLFLVVLVVWPM